ncbi:unnamed protein product [Rhodiola kirilowii]
MISQRRGRLLSTGRLSSIDVGNTHKNDFSARRTTTPTVKPCLRCLANWMDDTGVVSAKVYP